jgi:CubicO group peptidase (beta-lactamase class C family)
MTAILLLFLLFGAVLLALAPRAPETPRRVDNVSEMEDFFAQLVASQNPPGLSVAVVRGDAVVYENSFGFADAPSGAPTTVDTVYRWWSLTKLLTAIGVLQLDEEGLIDIDDDVREYLPDFGREMTFRGEPVAPIRIRQLLNHSSGLRNLRLEILRWTHLEGAGRRDPDELLAGALERYSRLRSTPGRRGYYSNLGYFVLGALIEKASGDSYEDYVRSNIVDPLGMELTGFEIDDDMRAHLALASHPLIDFQTLFLPAIDNVDSYVKEIHDGQIWFKPFLLDVNSYGGAMGSVYDATKLLRALLNEGRLDGRAILSPVTVRRFLDDGWVRAGSSSVAPPSLRRQGMQHGMGFWVFPEGEGNTLELGRMHEHTGAGPGFATILRLYPGRNLGVAVLANGTSLDRRGIADLLATVFGEAEAEAELDEVPTSTPTAIEPTER